MNNPGDPNSPIYGTYAEIRSTRTEGGLWHGVQPLVLEGGEIFEPNVGHTSLVIT